MPGTTLIAVLSLDGAWRTGEASSALLGRLLAAVKNRTGPVWTDVPELRSRRIPGLHWEEIAALAAKALMPSKPRPFAILGTPALHALILEGTAARSGIDLLLLRQPEIVLGPQRATLAAHFTPPDGKRTRFRLLSTHAGRDGALCHYGSISAPKKSIPR